MQIRHFDMISETLVVQDGSSSREELRKLVVSWFELVYQHVAKKEEEESSSTNQLQIENRFKQIEDIVCALQCGDKDSTILKLKLITSTTCDNISNDHDVDMNHILCILVEGAVFISPLFSIV